MRLLALQLALLTALLAWRLRCRGVSLGWRRAAIGVGGAAALLTLPHLLWGWEVHQHLPSRFLRLQMGFAAGWWFFALLVGMGLWAWDAAAARFPHRGPEPVDPGRRRLLGGAPLALGLVAPVGVAEAAREPPPTPVRIASPHLPPGLEGFRILQVSDVHLGAALGLDWLERALDRVGPLPLDLVAVTGDLSDDLELLAPALARIARVPARFGQVIIPGNHEHYVGIERFLKEVQASPVRLLTGKVEALQRGGETLQLLGIDYPHQRGVKDRVQFARDLDAVTAKVTPGFKLLLSHHPDAFDAAADRGIDVVLSGHTHGGQINVLGRSLLVGWLKYPRGHYARGESRLFVTTGLGHWMPFRIDCPTELPVIELVRG